jgi:phosphoribosyl 1,2-cyclic phosphate phosphodiesterase
MEVTLLGTGDTTGTPTVGCECPTCERAREMDVERTRFSVHVRNEATDETLLIDASPDFRHQFLREGLAPPDEAVITHIHFDHLDGLGNCYRLVDELTVHAADETDPETNESVAGTVASDYDYLDQLSIHPQTPHDTFEAAGLEVTLLPVDHPPLLCYGVVVEEPDRGTKLAITGDTSYGIPERSRAGLADADLLLADAIVPASACEYHPLGGKHHDDEGTPRTFGTKHMTREGALDLAAELDAEAVRLVHVAHFFHADEAFAEPLAVDGESVRL